MKAWRECGSEGARVVKRGDWTLTLATVIVMRVIS
jgi:hypothetical protein